MKRYLMAFPAVCSHFSQCGHPLCPEEVSVRLSNHACVEGTVKVCNPCVFVQMEVVEKKSLHLCVTFLEQIAKMTSTVVLELCAEQCNLNDKVRKHRVPVVENKIQIQ